MRTINEIHIHCADTPSDRELHVPEIRGWHVNERGWNDIGYHFVITLDGITELGRTISNTPASISGHNHGAVAVCLVGGRSGRNDKRLFRPVQFKELKKVVLMLKELFPITSIKGHYEYNPHKTCPNFNVPEWLKKEELWTGNQ